jgi:hypothetical protein
MYLITVRHSVSRADSSKMKILGTEGFSITMLNAVQAGEYSMAGGIDVASRARVVLARELLRKPLTLLF